MDAHDPAYVEARDKLTQAIRDYDLAVSSDARVVIASSVVYEASTFDNDHGQIFTLQHVVLDGSLCSAVGMMDSAKARLNEYINGPSERNYSAEDDGDGDG